MGEVLDRTHTFVTRFVHFSHPAQADAVTLWVAHTHAFEAAVTTPRLAACSAEKQSGKTRLLEVLSLLVRGAVQTCNMSEAFLFRRISEGRVTVLLDEVDTIFSASKSEQNEGLRGLLNAGYRAGAKVGRVVGSGGGMSAVELDAFAPVALAGIGTLPDTIQDRSIVLAMRRRAPDEEVERFRFRDAAFEAGALAADLSDWCSDAIPALAEARPAIPEDIDDRAADCWEPLLAIADRAGGEWPDRARAAARALSGYGVVEEQSLGVVLLSDIRDLFGEVERMRTSVLVRSLCDLDESPWGEERWRLDERRLAKRLKPYGISPRTTRFQDGQAKGYFRADFLDAFSRYLPAVPSVPSVPESALQPNDWDGGTEREERGGDGYPQGYRLDEDLFSSASRPSAATPETVRTNGSSGTGGTDGTASPNGNGHKTYDPADTF